QQFGVKPDIMTLAKGIASGVAAGAIIADESVAPSLRPGMHASTFGGNPLAMAAGIATVQMIEDEGLLDNCNRMSEHFRTQLNSLVGELSIVRELRIQGLMIAIDLNVTATPAVTQCMQRGVLVNATHDTVLRLLPAMNITAEDVEQGCQVIAEVLREMDQEAE
ncbi:MAG: aminotransferase class III-fold pyridoxal phosphate-dependent enzyme, partial [Planctomycetaceae bacterium]